MAAAGAVLSGFRYYRVLGRFHRLRRVVAALYGLGDRLAKRSLPSRATAPVSGWIEELRARGYSIGLRLDRLTVAAIQRFARRQPCSQLGRHGQFMISEVLHRGLTPWGSAVAVADVTRPLDCPEIRQLTENALLVETATRYLGYQPRRLRVRLWWSPVSTLSDEERRKAGQAIDFHYDIEACNSLYAYFYLEGGGQSSGAHVVVEGSHGPKPVRTIAGSCFQPEERVLARYGADNVTVVSGDTGFGFFEDPACFHKALPPTRTGRLCLQLRYS